MEDDVIEGLGNIQLTTDEEEVIAISEIGRLEAIESCSLSLIRKFLTCKPFNKRAAKTTIRRTWGMDEGLQIMEIGPNLFQFKFQLEFDMNLIIRGGPWTFESQLLMNPVVEKRDDYGKYANGICIFVGSNMGSSVGYVFSPSSL